MDPSKSWTNWDDSDSGIRAGVHRVIRNTGGNENAGTTYLHERVTLDNRASTGGRTVSHAHRRIAGHKRFFQ
jgi:hypothetical protein